MFVFIPKRGFSGKIVLFGVWSMRLAVQVSACEDVVDSRVCVLVR